MYSQIKLSRPEKSFYELERNTGAIGDETLTILEDIYTHYDTRIASIFNEIREKKDIFFENPNVLPNLIIFIVQLFWRIPKNDDLVDKLIDDLDFRNTGFDLVDKNGNSCASLELQKTLKTINQFRKLYHIFLTNLSLKEGKGKTDFENWIIYNRNNNYQLTGDNPVIFDALNGVMLLNGITIFPLSSDKVLIHSRKSTPQQLPADFLFYQDMTIIEQSKRFVCCSNKDYLIFMVKIYNNNIDKCRVNTYNEKLFDYLN
jgi:hypothetical protein